MRAIYRLIEALVVNLQTALTGIATLQGQLADLKANNPAIEDEVAAIEGTVAEIGAALSAPPSTP